MLEFFTDLIGYGIALTVVFGFFTLALIFIILHCVGRMRMFIKAEENGLAAWIPFYSDYVMCRITMGHGYWFLFGYIPVIGVIAKIVYAVEISLSFGQGYVFSALYFFFPWICDMIIGFGRDGYRGAQNPEEQLKSIFNWGKKN